MTKRYMLKRLKDLIKHNEIMACYPYCLDTQILILAKIMVQMLESEK